MSPSLQQPPALLPHPESTALIIPDLNIIQMDTYNQKSEYSADGIEPPKSIPIQKVCIIHLCPVSCVEKGWAVALFFVALNASRCHIPGPTSTTRSSFTEILAC